MNVKHSFFEPINNKKYTLFEDRDAVEQISLNLLSTIPSKRPECIVVACIGTDRSTGDSLGPLVGTFLSEKPSSPFFVYGTLENPIHAVNLQERVQEIKDKHPNSFIIAVDACLGRTKSVGTVQIGTGPLKPGAGVNKNLPEIGDIHITGIVNVSGFMEFFVLQNTRLNLVVKMAKTIANGVYLAGESIKSKTIFPDLTWTLEPKEATT
ncbi:MAG: spore protease YyaC [Bacillus sp. (in: firmicutes)]